jgi:hypothetical protein
MPASTSNLICSRTSSVLSVAASALLNLMLIEKFGLVTARIRRMIRSDISTRLLAEPPNSSVRRFVAGE